MTDRISFRTGGESICNKGTKAHSAALPSRWVIFVFKTVPVRNTATKAPTLQWENEEGKMNRVETHRGFATAYACRH